MIRLIESQRPRRRFLRAFALTGLLVSASMLSLELAQATRGGEMTAAALTAGQASLQQPGSGATPLNSGGSATPFVVRLPTGSVCSGDTASGNYRTQSFLIASSVDPGSLTYNVSGPVPLGEGAALRQPLFSAGDETPFVNQSTAAATGLVLGLPIEGFSFAVFGASGATTIPPGRYTLGIACTFASGSQVDKYWSVQIDVTASASDAPGGFAWTVVSAAPPPSTTTTTVAGTTSTTTVASGATTTTVAGATTTTVAGGTTTTTVAAGAALAATLNPLVPTAGASYKVTHPNCRVGDTITVTQPQSTPTSSTATCALPVAGLVRPEQAAALGTATVTFTAAPTAPGTYTVTSTGATSGTRTTTFTIVGATPTTVSSTGGIPSGGSTGSIPATGSSTTSVIVWGILLLVFGRMAILFGRKPKVISANR